LRKKAIIAELNLWWKAVRSKPGGFELKGGIEAGRKFIDGLETLPLRMRVHCDNANLVAGHLAQHAKITKVIYPSLMTGEMWRTALPGTNRYVRRWVAIGGKQTARSNGDVPSHRLARQSKKEPCSMRNR
jgi:Cys/Met metabolism PLP-dependent enzyme